ncbi:hypothetical protein [Natronococcus wangiae]|uniref:hypothetical protein n=1 Tax=Natronococcus wangiae TaxID=3068275 RepID=UPI00273D6D72|nr:hypothetical protein [Natronococcus sp. AD5]
MSFLFGFPTPVVEVILALVVLVLGLALYFGYRFETVDIEERETRSTDTISREGAGK